jgi:archaemetzincin
VKVWIMLVGDVPPRLAESVLAELPPPFDWGTVDPVILDLERCYDRQRAQFDAVRMLEQVPAPEQGWVNIAVTGTDLFLPALTYVFGLAELGGGRAVASFARLRAEEADANAAAVLHRRLAVEVVHELGHCLGLVHCPVPSCPMHRSMWPEQVDLKQIPYCPTCLTTIAGKREE